MPTSPAMAPTISLASTIQTEPAAPGGAEAPAKPQSPLGGSFLFPMLLVVGIFYFILIRPEKRKQKQREALLKSIKKGDRVMTTSGIYAVVAAVQDDVVTLQVADGVRMRFSRAAVQSIEAEPEASAP